MKNERERITIGLLFVKAHKHNGEHQKFMWKIKMIKKFLDELENVSKLMASKNAEISTKEIEKIKEKYNHGYYKNKLDLEKPIILKELLEKSEKLTIIMHTYRESIEKEFNEKEVAAMNKGEGNGNGDGD